ncbi:MAG: hypothetical protein GY854_01950, partial [Deltaproteobacteria bacterium]|nr:hypothetical protein [Deltaproteobacteria bacterium]
VVKVRNDVTSGKGLYAYTHRFGGLYRRVELEATSSPSIDYAYVRPDFDKSLARVCVTLRKTGSRKREAATLAVKIVDPAGKVVAEREKKISLTAVATDVVEDIPVPNPRHWTPETPHLYTAQMVLSAGGKDIDDWNERFGIRKIEVRQAHFYLNNYRYFFRGYGDNCLYPITLSPPASRDEYRKNLKMARAFGFNYSRFHTHCP